MLTTLSVMPAKRRWLRKRGGRVTGDTLPAGSGRYLRITAEAGKDGQPDWAAVRRAAGREAGRLLLPRGLQPPADSRIAPFAGQALARRMMGDTALQLLKMASLNPRLVCVSVYDEQALLPDLPLLFLPYAADVRIITRQPERYRLQQHTAMQEYGAVLSVFTDPARLAGSLLVLAPAGVPDMVRLPLNGTGLCLSALPANRRGGVVDGYLPKVRDSLRAATPPGCELLSFLAGLYELSGVREIAMRPPEFLRLEGRMVTLREALHRMAGLDNIVSL